MAENECTHSATLCLLKVGHYCAQLDQYDRAAKIYEQVAATVSDHSLDTLITKYAVCEYLLRAGLCHLCNSWVSAHLAVQEYENIYSDFQVCLLFLA